MMDECAFDTALLEGPTKTKWSWKKAVVMSKLPFRTTSQEGVPLYISYRSEESNNPGYVAISLDNDIDVEQARDDVSTTMLSMEVVGARNERFRETFHNSLQAMMNSIQSSKSHLAGTEDSALEAVTLSPTAPTPSFLGRHMLLGLTLLAIMTIQWFVSRYGGDDDGTPEN